MEREVGEGESAGAEWIPGSRQTEDGVVPSGRGPPEEGPVKEKNTASILGRRGSRWEGLQTREPGASRTSQTPGSGASRTFWKG